MGENDAIIGYALTTSRARYTFIVTLKNNKSPTQKGWGYFRIFG